MKLDLTICIEMSVPKGKRRINEKSLQLTTSNEVNTFKHLNASHGKCYAGKRWTNKIDFVTSVPNCLVI